MAPLSGVLDEDETSDDLDAFAEQMTELPAFRPT